eukprot:scaffold40651_cov29-Prasinocladus_malaysianus.AAC.1
MAPKTNPRKASEFRFGWTPRRHQGASRQSSTLARRNSDWSRKKSLPPSSSEFTSIAYLVMSNYRGTHEKAFTADSLMESSPITSGRKFHRFHPR